MSVQNLNIIACKLELALTRVNSHRLKVAREEKWKKEEMVEKRKTKVMATKRYSNKEEINL